MKRVILSLLCCAILPFCCSLESECSTIDYALIKPDCILYADQTCSVAVCRLEPDYFVSVIESNDAVCKVGYSDLVGYVLSDKISIVDYVPKNLYPIFPQVPVSNDGNTVAVRDKPDHVGGKVVKRILDGDLVKFYGSVLGSSQIDQIGSTWYYVKTSDGDNGYVYSLYLSPPVFPKNDYLARIENTTPVATSSNFSSITHVAIIIGLCLPVVVIFVIGVKNRNKGNG